MTRSNSKLPFRFTGLEAARLRLLRRWFVGIFAGPAVADRGMLRIVALPDDDVPVGLGIELAVPAMMKGDRPWKFRKGG